MLQEYDVSEKFLIFPPQKNLGMYKGEGYAFPKKIREERIV